jgi:hypothetical protein
MLPIAARYFGDELPAGLISFTKTGVLSAKAEKVHTKKPLRRMTGKRVINDFLRL